MMIAGAVLALLFSIFLLIYNIKHAAEKRKIVIVVNSVLGTVAVAVLIYWSVCHLAFKSDKKEYDVRGDKLLDGLKYEKTVEDYYVFNYSQLLSPGEKIAVPKDSVSLPTLTRVFPYVMIYMPLDNAEKGTIKVSGETFVLWANPVKITTEYVGFTVLTVLFSFGTAFVYDLIVFIRILLRKNRAAGGSDNNISL
ncbi:MAG: hypothetical protein IKO27_06020 [Ruminococcus sp.]|nr:hypothetical protein [Ruminococcus sp.]